MADVSKIQLPSGTTYTIKDARIPTATSADEDKHVTVNSSGELVLTTLPIYDGSVATSASGVSF